MPLLSGLESVAKGASATITLDKVELFALPKVAADPYFSQPANVQSVKVIYKSTVGRQRRILSFDMSQVTPTAQFKLSAKARNEFMVDGVYLIDFDSGMMKVTGAEVPTGLNVSLVTAQLIAGAKTFTLANNLYKAGYFEGDSGEIQSLTFDQLGFKGTVLVNNVQPVGASAYYIGQTSTGQFYGFYHGESVVTNGTLLPTLTSPITTADGSSVYIGYAVDKGGTNYSCKVLKDGVEVLETVSKPFGEFGAIKVQNNDIYVLATWSNRYVGVIKNGVQLFQVDVLSVHGLSGAYYMKGVGLEFGPSGEIYVAGETMPVGSTLKSFLITYESGTSYSSLLKANTGTGYVNAQATSMTLTPTGIAISGVIQGPNGTFGCLWTGAFGQANWASGGTLVNLETPSDIFIRDVASTKVYYANGHLYVLAIRSNQNQTIVWTDGVESYPPNSYTVDGRTYSAFVLDMAVSSAGDVFSCGHSNYAYYPGFTRKNNDAVQVYQPIPANEEIVDVVKTQTGLHFLGKKYRPGVSEYVSVSNGVSSPRPEVYTFNDNRLIVEGNDEYIIGYAGYWQGVVCYKNGVKVFSSQERPLPFTGGGEPTAWTVKNGFLYITGYDYDNDGKSFGHVFKVNLNDSNAPIEDTILTAPSIAWGAEPYSIFIEGNDVYAAGSGYDNNATLPLYWKNGVLIVVSYAYSVWVDSIFVSGSDVYLCGYMYGSSQDPMYSANVVQSGGMVIKNGLLISHEMQNGELVALSPQEFSKIVVTPSGAVYTLDYANQAYKNFVIMPLSSPGSDANGVTAITVG